MSQYFDVSHLPGFVVWWSFSLWCLKDKQKKNTKSKLEKRYLLLSCSTFVSHFYIFYRKNYWSLWTSWCGFIWKTKNKYDENDFWLSLPNITYCVDIDTIYWIGLASCEAGQIFFKEVWLRNFHTYNFW